MRYLGAFPRRPRRAWRAGLRIPPAQAGDHVIGEAVVSTRPGLRGQRLRPFKSSPC